MCQDFNHQITLTSKINKFLILFLPITLLVGSLVSNLTIVLICILFIIELIQKKIFICLKILNLILQMITYLLEMKFKNLNINYKKPKGIVLILFILFMTILVSFDFFKNVFSIIKYNKDERIIRNSKFCEGDSQGFVSYLNKNYNFGTNPILLNNTISPLSDWIYFDFKKEQSKSELILLNYEETQTIKTEFKNSRFIARKLPPLLREIKGINISFEDELNIDKTFVVNLYKVQNKKKENLTSNQVLLKKGLNNKFIDLSLNDSEGRKLRSYEIEIKPFKKGMIKNINLIINNQIKLSDYQIIEKKQNCYFLRKND